MKVILSGIMV